MLEAHSQGHPRIVYRRSEPDSPTTPATPQTPGGGRRYPMWRKFERPNYVLIAAHTLGCVVAFPLVYLLPKAIAKGMSLYMARVIVG